MEDRHVRQTRQTDIHTDIERQDYTAGYSSRQFSSTYDTRPMHGAMSHACMAHKTNDAGCGALLPAYTITRERHEISL